jgi:quinoprotein glucose dehydrogenase
MRLAFNVCVFASCLIVKGEQPHQASTSGEWSEYGGTVAGQRYSPSRQITPGNVKQLQIAWVFYTHIFDRVSSKNDARSMFEATPVLWQGTLYFASPYDEIFALDAATGKLLWGFDPEVDRDSVFGVVTSRGVALWHSEHPGRGLCHDAVIIATLDRRLIARDARTGAACLKFGVQGTVDLTKGIRLDDPKYLGYTSPPIVVGKIIVLGSSVADNQKLFAGSGAVRGFDVLSGKQLWSWEPVSWTAGHDPPQSGSGNAWAPLAADAKHDLVFVPTGSASLDYFGGTRIGDNRDADSIVALRASTGKKVWAFQLVHHDIWDYDTASQPLLFEFRNSVPAIAVTNKTGMIYLFNRLTGEPLFPIVERPVPQSRLSGEATWPTQPFSTLPSLTQLQYSIKDLRFSRAEDERFCASALGFYRYEGLFTPPSQKGSVIYPAALGGPNWGSSAYDPQSGIMYTRVSSLPFVLRLRPRIGILQNEGREFWEKNAPIGFGGDPMSQRRRPDTQFRVPDLGIAPDRSLMLGSPFTLDLRAFVGPSGTPCGPQPFGRLVATDLNNDKQLWSVSHGSMGEGETGSVGTAGPIVTAGGLVFVAASLDPYLRAYDAKTGTELWKGLLPSPANATPMSYTANGRQFVIVADGGNIMGRTSEIHAARPDFEVIGFALPQTPQRVGRWQTR